MEFFSDCQFANGKVNSIKHTSQLSQATFSGKNMLVLKESIIVPIFCKNE